MRKPLLLFMLAIVSTTSYSQVGIGTNTPSAHAVLDLRSPTNNQGLLIPSLTNAQRTASSLTSSLGSQDNGLLVYDTDDKKFYFWKDALWQPVLDGAVSGVGTVTNVGTGTGITGGPITVTGTISLANTPVAPATYGDATHVSQVAVDAQGRITNASNVLITGAAPTGAAGGDLTGTFPNPTIAANAVTAAKIAAGDYSSKINVGSYSISITGNAATATTATNFSGALAGDVTGTQGATVVSKLQGSAVSSTAPTANQILKWNGSSWLPSADANSGGTVTNVATGTGLSGGPITGSGTITLANTAVTPATYGDATHVSQVVVDAQGRITNASSVLITGAAPTGAAGGDLTGTFPNPTIAANAVTAAKIAAGDYSSKINVGSYSISITGNAATATTATNFSGALVGDVTGTQGATVVSKLQGSAVSSTAPTANQILKWNGSSWLPSADANSGGTVTSVATGTGLSGGPITGSGTISLANTAVAPATYGDATHVSQVAIDAQGRITNASSVLITGVAPTGAAGGDLTGSFPNPTIASNAVTAAKIAAGDYSSKINVGSYSISITGNAATATTATNFSGALVGDVTGTQGATVVSKLQGSAVSSTAPTANQILKWNGTSWLPSADANSGGTVTRITTSARLTGGPITTTGALDLATSGVTATTYGSATQVGQFAVDAYGRITSASNVTISGIAPTGAAGGDLAGTYPNPTIGTGKVTSTAILDGAIADADINASAGIQDSKLATISTAGKVSGNAITAGTIGGSTAIYTSGSITSLSSIAAMSGSASSIIAASNSSTGIAINATSTSGNAMNATSSTGNGVYSYSTGGGRAVWGYSPSYIGVEGQSNSSYGVYAYSATGTGLYSTSGNTNGGYGVYGEASGGLSGEISTYGYGVYGKNTYSGNYGYLGGGNGVYGYSNGGVGVNGYGAGTYGYGLSGSGYIGVYAYGTSYGGYFYGTNYAIYASGTAGGTTSWNGTSDRRYKKNIETLSNPLSKILSLRGVNFDWKTDEFPKMNFEKKRQIGFIAQEVREILPEIVTKDSDGYLAVGYDRVVPVLVEAMKAQQKIIDEQKAKIEQLEKRDSEFAQRLSSIEALLQKKNSLSSISLTAKKNEK